MEIFWLSEIQSFREMVLPLAFSLTIAHSPVSIDSRNASCLIKPDQMLMNYSQKDRIIHFIYSVFWTIYFIDMSTGVSILFNRGPCIFLSII